MPTQPEVKHDCIITIGRFVLYRLYDGKLYLRSLETGEGMGMNEQTEKKFEQMVLEFFAENF